MSIVLNSVFTYIFKGGRKLKKRISILIPAYNEQEVIHQLFERLNTVLKSLKLYDFEILFVNDGSSDSTIEIIKALRQRDTRICFVDLSRNFGKETAMIAGLDYASGDAVIIIDADLQDPPELIPEMIRYWEQGYDDIYAKRRSRAGETWIKKLTANTFYKLLKQMTRIPIQENTGDFRLLDRRCVEALKKIRETQRYTKGMFSWIGYNKKEILFDRDPRAAGETKWNYLKLMNLAIEGITSFTTAPLRLSSLIGCFISIIAFIYMGWIIAKTLLFGESVQGYPSLMTAVLFLGGIQLISLGVIGEYLGRVFNETKGRPLYFVNEYNDEKVLNNSVVGTPYRVDYNRNLHEK
jgi:polyisoprenyl-phosphate glycosyltransferase